jgi:hypothetical protein
MTILSWASALLVSALAIIGCAGPYQGMGPYDQSYGDTYNTPPPQKLYSTPWVGPNTPWVFYQGDWFQNGMLYNFYGNQYGWAPYYAYPPTYIVRPNTWYEPRWNTWYQQHPQYRQTFTQKYPYWRDHRHGQRYDQNFYNRYHRGQGEWQKGFHGRAIERPQPEARRPGSARGAPREGWRPSSGQVTPPEGRRIGPAQATPRQGQRSGPGQVASPEGQRIGPGQVASPEGRRPDLGQVNPRQGQRPSPGQVAPPEGRRIGSGQVSPREGQRSGPAQVTPPQGQRSGPGRVAPPEGRKPGSASNGGRTAPVGKPGKTGPGEERP